MCYSSPLRAHKVCMVQYTNPNTLSLLHLVECHHRNSAKQCSVISCCFFLFCLFADHKILSTNYVYAPVSRWMKLQWWFTCKCMYPASCKSAILYPCLLYTSTFDQCSNQPRYCIAVKLYIISLNKIQVSYFSQNKLCYYIS